MIGYLSGTIHSKTNDSLILLVQGVGYLVTVAPTTLNILHVDQQLELYIYTNVKEDALDLYGFKSQMELTLFKLVLSVSGIGPKTAMLVIDRGAEPLKEAIATANTDFFLTIPRLGQKNAQRIIIDLKNKLGGVASLDLSGINSELMEVSEALESMGYTKQEALKAIKEIPADLKLEQKITAALRLMGKTKVK